jgi:hypothetical protein
MLYRRAGMQDAGSRATARGARAARAGAPQASPYAKPPSKILARTACSARSAIPHAVLALAQAEPCMQRACHYRTTSREPRLPRDTSLSPHARSRRHAHPRDHACNVYTITARPRVHVGHALTRAAPRTRPLTPAATCQAVMLQICTGETMHATCMPFPHALTRATLYLIPAGARRPARTPDHRRQYRHARRTSSTAPASTARPTPPCPLPLVRRPGT